MGVTNDCRRKNLQRDRSFQVEVLRLVNDTHPSTADQSVDAVATEDSPNGEVPTHVLLVANLRTRLKDAARSQRLPDLTMWSALAAGFGDYRLASSMASASASMSELSL